MADVSPNTIFYYVIVYLVKCEPGFLPPGSHIEVIVGLPINYFNSA